MQSPTPPRVKEGKDQLERGVRLSSAPGQMRAYYCRTCGREERGTVIPEGWYSLTRHAGSELEKPTRLGLYCSLDCLCEQMPRLAAIAEKLGETWKGATAWSRQWFTERGSP